MVNICSFIELIGDQDNETKTIFTNFLLFIRRSSGWSGYV